MSDERWPEWDRRSPDPWRTAVDRRIAALEQGNAEILAIVKRIDRDQLVSDTKATARTDAIKDIGKIILWVCAAVTGIAGLVAMARQMAGV